MNADEAIDITWAALRRGAPHQWTTFLGRAASAMAECGLPVQAAIGRGQPPHVLTSNVRPLREAVWALISIGVPVQEANTATR